MEAHDKSLVFEHEINASAADIFKAFTNSAHLKHWLCQIASVDGSIDGRVYIAWENSYYTAGHFVEFIPDEKVVFTWNGKGEPNPTEVTIQIIPSGDKQLMRLTHSGMSESPEWERNWKEIEKGWLIALPNLVSMLETGIDLRISQRPLLGIYPELYIRKNDDDPFPLKFGIRVVDIVEGLLAGIGGLQVGDILIKLENKPITNYNTLVDSIMGYKAGDEVEVTFYRDAQKLIRKIRLSAMALPEIYDSPQKLADSLSTNQSKICDEMMAMLRGITDSEASFRPAIDEWSIKEIIAHLIHSERDQQLWIHNMVQGIEPQYDDEPHNLMARVQATVALYPSLPQLLELLRASLKETSGLIANLPQDVTSNKSVFWNLSFVCMEYGLHFRSHSDQIENNLKLVREGK